MHIDKLFLLGFPQIKETKGEVKEKNSHQWTLIFADEKYKKLVTNSTKENLSDLFNFSFVNFALNQEKRKLCDF